MPQPKKSTPKEKLAFPPATTVESREQQLIALAVDLAEKQLIEGRASAQVITHYLKLGTVNAAHEREALHLENELKKAKLESYASRDQLQELYQDALNAMRTYQGHDSVNDDDDEDY